MLRLFYQAPEAEVCSLFYLEAGLLIDSAITEDYDGNGDPDIDW